jgi:hypothetical protein
MRLHCAIRQSLLAVWAVCQAAAVAADDQQQTITDSGRPGIAIIIDDLGYQQGPGSRVARLPGAIACAFLPHGPHTAALAREAHAQHKEVMLHLPMQPVGHIPAGREAGVLTLDMTRPQFVRTLQANLDAVPHASGLNNHMGSLLTQHPGTMAWLMQALGEHGNLFFVDSRTSTATVARQLAGEYGIPSMSRNVFLDNEPDPEAVRAQFRQLLEIARREGTALAIGHPYPATFEVLEEELAQLADRGVQLVPVSRLIELQNERRLAWQAPLSR